MYRNIIVTVYFRDKSNTKIIRAKMENGHAKVPLSILEQMAEEIGCSNGQTYSYG